MVELVDAPRSERDEGNLMGVRVPLPAPKLSIEPIWYVKIVKVQMTGCTAAVDSVHRNALVGSLRNRSERTLVSEFPRSSVGD